MKTVKEKLNQDLISWYTLLSGWSLDGSLVATAEHVLDLDGENAIENANTVLRRYIDQWSTGDFSSIPAIVLLSNDCLLYTSPSPRDVEESRMPSSA